MFRKKKKKIISTFYMVPVEALEEEDVRIHTFTAITVPVLLCWALKQRTLFSIVHVESCVKVEGEKTFATFIREIPSIDGL